MDAFTSTDSLNLHHNQNGAAGEGTLQTPPALLAQDPKVELLFHAFQEASTPPHFGGRRKPPSSERSRVRAGISGRGRRAASAGRTRRPRPPSSAIAQAPGRSRSALGPAGRGRAHPLTSRLPGSHLLGGVRRAPSHPGARTPSFTSLTPSHFQDRPPATPLPPPRVPRPSGPGQPGPTPPHSACSLATQGLPALHKYLVLRLEHGDARRKPPRPRHLFSAPRHLHLAAPDLRVGLAHPPADPIPSLLLSKDAHHPRLPPPAPAASARPARAPRGSWAVRGRASSPRSPLPSVPLPPLPITPAGPLCLSFPESLSPQPGRGHFSNSPVPVPARPHAPGLTPEP